MIALPTEMLLKSAINGEKIDNIDFTISIEATARQSQPPQSHVMGVMESLQPAFASAHVMSPRFKG